MKHHEDIVYPDTIPFVLVHLVCLAAIWTGASPTALALCAVLFVGRMFGVTAGYHRYFSHRSFRTSRAFQFALAWLAQSSGQKSVLWWSALHRRHHRHSDTEHDVHSPRHHGLLYCHFGWIFDRRFDATEMPVVNDLARFPELRWLHRFERVPVIALALAVLSLGGLQALVVGFFWSTVMLFHATFLVNSLAHVHGRQRYETGDDSRNNWWLAIMTMGEGWHNNHHASPGSARQGFRWYEIDFTFYGLWCLSRLGIVWNLGRPQLSSLARRDLTARRATAPVVHAADARLALASSTARKP